MRPLILLLPLLTGCISAGTEVGYDPETKKFEISRSWLAGPVHLELEITTPEGMKAKLLYESEINLDAAQAIRLEETKALRAAAEALAAAAVAGAAP